jgi:GT2 family glycosyltransferase/glycosyltransferase involved in cell wall biosynthesis
MHPKVGIVILSYNASQAVRATLAGLRQAKNQTPYKVLLIDNHSQEKERRAIRQAFEVHTSAADLPWQYIQLEKNLGFAGGNNVGIKEFLTDPDITHICLLNSDVIVTDYWLDRLVAKRVDMISAVTNKADSEQCVPVNYTLDLTGCLDPHSESVPSDSFDTINAFAQDWYRAWEDNVVETEVTFFLVLLTRGLVEKVGLLDEHFFPGGYEDDDYCVRVLAAGYPIFLARDVFLHHFGSASFGQLQHQYFNEKASNNRQYLEKKHNITVKRRPQKPITSYAQDVLYALKGRGERSLQLDYNRLYQQTLRQLVTHYQTEFTAIHGHLLHCGQPVPASLQGIVAQAMEKGSLVELWDNALHSIQEGLQEEPCDAALLAVIEEKLNVLIEAAYTKAESNRLMHEFLLATGVLSAGPDTTPKSKVQKIKWLLTKGVAFVRDFRGIVFFGGYAYPEREKDGYFQRIRTIDSLFKDRWRVYVDHMPLTSQKSWYDRPAPKVLVLHIHNHRHRWFMRLLVGLCVLRCRVIYYHSVLRMEDSKFGSFMRWPGIRKLIDIHGVVPEELRLHNDFYQAGIYEEHEKLALRKADYAIVVTHAMHRYFQHKYRAGLHARVIVLPIMPDILSLKQHKSYVGGKPVVVYAGGTHKWQQVPRMIDAIAATREQCIHRFFCPDPHQVKEMMPEALRRHPNITVDTRPFSELLREYEACHYGFVLREDIIVNHAACPTKLVEYLAMGIIPIVDCEEIGDFKALGMQFVRLRDFMEGKLPMEGKRNRMALANFEVFTKLQALSSSGKKELQNALGVSRDSGLKHKVKSGIGRLLPRYTASGKVARQLWNKLKGEPPVFAASNETHRKVAGQKEGSKVVPVLPACDVLVQVDNFLVGGLENVVLELNDTLIKSGLKVTLLVLGEAGDAVARAREKGMAVCVTAYEETAYRQMLQQAAPKLVISHYSIHGAAQCAHQGISLLQVIHNTYMWFNEEQAQAFSEAAEHTTAFIAVSEYARSYSVARLGVPEEKCLSIPNGIDIAQFTRIDKQKARQEIRTKHGLTEEDFVFLSVGSITHQKNHISTVRAFHKVVQYCPNARLVILGKLYELQLWAEIDEYITDHQLEAQVIYAGESRNPPAYYAMADAFVHSAFFEGGQLSLVEALVANLPIVTTEIGFARHFRGQAGVSLVPPPVEIINYYGAIWELTPTAACERLLAIQMLQVYTEPVRPNLPREVIELMDKGHAFKLYVDLITTLLEEGRIPEAAATASWPDAVEKTGKLILEPSTH